jgi:putative nucleotidyltransferase with HDIG domain
MSIREKLKNKSGSIQIGLFVAVIIYLSFLLPNKPGFNYRYEKGSVWQYDDLYAPMDYSLKRDSAQLDSLKRMVLEQSIPYYRKDTTIKASVITQINNAFEQVKSEARIQSDTSAIRIFDQLQKELNSELSKAYQKGIVEEKDQQGQFSRMLYLLEENGEANLQHRIYYVGLEQAREASRQLFLARNMVYLEEYQSLIEPLIIPNIVPDSITTQRVRQNEIGKISPYGGKMEKGELIIRRGSRVHSEVYQKLESLRDVLQFENAGKRNMWLVYLGNLLLISLCVGLFYLYLRFVEPWILLRTRKIIFLLLWFVAFPTIIYFIEAVEGVSAYIVPFCVVPIVIKNFMNERLAFITVIVLIMIASLITSLGLEYALLMVLAGLVAVLFGTETRYWARFFNSIFIIFLTFLLGHLGLSLTRGESLSGIDWTIYTALLINVVLTLLAYPIIPLLERIFGFTSSITLAELSDLNKPLLKKLSIKAPGTFQHSIQVSNLAEAAASKIGANSLLAKVGSLYHDIGKMKNPMYFVENAGPKSMHEKLDPLESGRIILDHVSEGAQLARENKLPAIIIDFIKTHHGTTRVEYFMHKYKVLYPQDKDVEAKFTYPGPRPKTREQSIVMLADSIEAASKSLKFKNYTELDAFVDKIIAQKLQAGQLDHSELSFEELEICRKVFKKTLRSIYHGRISYPGE